MFVGARYISTNPRYKPLEVIYIDDRNVKFNWIWLGDGCYTHNFKSFLERHEYQLCNNALSLNPTRLP